VRDRTFEVGAVRVGIPCPTESGETLGLGGIDTGWAGWIAVTASTGWWLVGAIKAGAILASIPSASVVADTVGLSRVYTGLPGTDHIVATSAGRFCYRRTINAGTCLTGVPVAAKLGFANQLRHSVDT